LSNPLPAKSRRYDITSKLYFMNFLARRSLIWVILNLVGMLTFLRLAAELWVLPGEEGLPGGPGDPFYWFFLLVPFQLIFLAVNFCALYVIVKHRSEPNIKKRVCLWSLVEMGLEYFSFRDSLVFSSISTLLGEE
jgi:hypothetical protein